MSTRSIIGVRKADGSIHTIYCHFDGYPSHQLPILAHYPTQKDAEALVALGGLSVLGEEIGQKHEWAKHHLLPEAAKWCCAYHRDRGEELKVKVFHPDETDGVVTPADREAMPGYWGEDYYYLFENGQWYFRTSEKGWQEASSWQPELKKV